MTAEWLPVRHMWAKCYTNQLRHLGNTSSNRVEAAHSSFKKWLQSSTGAVDTVYKKNDDYIEAQHLQIRKLLEDSRQKKLLRADGKPFRELNTKVTLEALRLMLFEVAVEGEPCTCTFLPTYGLPCRCSIQLARRENRDFALYDVLPFWTVINYREPPTRPEWDDHSDYHRGVFQGLVQEVLDRGDETIRGAIGLLRSHLHPENDGIDEPHGGQPRPGRPRTSTTRNLSHFEHVERRRGRRSSRLPTATPDNDGNTGGAPNVNAQTNFEDETEPIHNDTDGAPNGNAQTNFENGTEPVIHNDT
ncbi:unnamed protein product, partial [Linum tenue]